MKYLKVSVIQIASILLLFFLAALPLYLYNMDGRLIFQPLEIPNEIRNFLIGLFTGESYFYMQGDRRRFLISDLSSFFLFFLLLFNDIIGHRSHLILFFRDLVLEKK